MKPASHSKRVLLTGIDGFTGKHLEEALMAQGYDVYGTVIGIPSQANHRQCDLRKADEVASVVASVQPLYVVHLAAISFVGENDRSLIYDVNVSGTEHLLEALLRLPEKPLKVVLASSATVYGNQGVSVLDEGLCPKPVNHYGYSKLVMEHLAATYFGRLDILVTRPFNYTGPGQEKHFVIPKIVVHFREGKRRMELGNIDVYREFNDVRFAVDAYIRLMQCDTHSEIVNLCSGTTVSLKEVLKIMEEMAGYTMEVAVNPAFVRPNEIVSLSGSPEKLCSMIEPSQAYDIASTLKSLYEERP